MIKRILFIALMICSSVLLASCVKVEPEYISRDMSYQEFIGDDIDRNETDEITKYVFSMGCIQTEEAACQIAYQILKTVYGDDFDEGLPLVVGYDDEEQVWMVTTQLPEGAFGGTCNIILKKSNAEVVAIWATK